MKTHYIYAHSNAQHGIFYVGKGSDKRLFTTGNRSKLWKEMVNGNGFTASILEKFESEQEAFEREKFWIAKFKADGLCKANVSDGGAGVTVQKRWWGNKISESLTGIKRAKGVDNGNFKPLSKDDLINLYVNQKKSSTEVGKILGVSYATVCTRLKEFGIEARTGSKKIICVESGEEFDSISAAAKITGAYRENIRKVLSGKYKTTNGCTFKYKE